METTLINSNNISQIILDSINNIFSTLFSSIDTSLYNILDNLVFINTDIFNDYFFENIFGTSSTNGLLLIANSLLIAFTVYYCFKLLYSNFISQNIESPYEFVFKLLIFGTLTNFSYFICKQIVNINFLLSSSILEIGENLFHKSISFSTLIQLTNSLSPLTNSNFNLFSFDGLLKSFISISLLSLLLSYALRYVMLKLFILLTPFVFLSLINQSTSWIFKSWFKALFSLLILQSFISIILLIIFSLDLTFSTIFSKLLFVGSIYSLIHANSYLQHLIGGISTDISSNLNLIKTIIK